MMSRDLDFDPEFRACFQQHLGEREPECTALSEPALSRLVGEYNRFLRLKYYVHCQRAALAHLPSDQLDEVLPLEFRVPRLLKIAWERHLLWTASYRSFCTRLGHFIESPLRVPGEDSDRRLDAGYRSALRLYESAFSMPAPEDFWPHVGDDPSASSTSIDLPSFDTVAARNVRDPGLDLVVSIASSPGFDEVAPLESYLLDQPFADDFRVFLRDKEPSIARLAEPEYDTLVFEYVKFMIVMKTVVIGRDAYNPSLSEREVNFLYPNNVAPSNIVDLVWHAHILCTAQYRAYCSAHFGRFMDHHPTIKSTAFDRNDDQGYASTIRVYKELFHLVPPYRWWPRPYEPPEQDVVWRRNLRGEMLAALASLRGDGDRGEGGSDECEDAHVSSGGDRANGDDRRGNCMLM